MKKHYLFVSIIFCLSLSLFGFPPIYIAMFLSLAAGVLGLMNYQAERKSFIQREGILAAKGYWKRNYKKWLDSVLIIIVTLVMIYLQISGFYDRYKVAVLVFFLLIGLYLFFRENKIRPRINSIEEKKQK